MAITIEDQPSNISPVYNELVFVASSTNTAEAGFQYVFDIYTGAVLRERHLIAARPDNGLGVFDAKEYLESVISSDIDETDTDFFNLNSNSFKGYEIKIGEKTDALGVVADLAVSGTLYAWNAVFDFEEWVDFNQTDHILLDSTKPFLTNAPNEQDIELNQHIWLYSANDVPGDYDHMQIVRYDSAGLPIGTTNIGNALQGAGDLFLRANVGTQKLEDTFGGAFFTGVEYYTAQAVDALFSPISQLYRFNITTPCRYPTKRIHFLNQLGGFDAYNFTMVADTNNSYNRTTVRTMTGEIDASNDWSNNKRMRGIKVTNTTKQKRLTLRSDWLTDEGITWLRELVESPEIYEERNGELIALHPTTRSHKESQHVYEQLFNLTVEFDFAVKNYSQRG